jgi:DNA-binding transcriptional ArsR family regulator
LKWAGNIAGICKRSIYIKTKTLAERQGFSFNPGCHSGAYLFTAYKFLHKNLCNNVVTFKFVTTLLHIMETRRDAFHAISDPTRRDILGMLATKPLNLNAVADHFDISRPAISRHIKVLTECGLVVIRQQGRERYCEVKLQKLREVSDWIDQYKKFWNQQFTSLGKYLDKVQSNKKSKK